MSHPQVVTMPYPPILLRVFRASLLVWILVRITYVGLLVVGVLAFGLLPPKDGIQAALHPAWPLRILLGILTAGLVQMERQRAHEPLLQANFGVSAAWFWATSFVAAGLSDLTVQALLMAV